MKPLNYQERRTAIFKFLIIGIITLLLIPLLVVLYQRAPEHVNLPPVAEEPKDTINEALVSSIQQKLQTAAQNQRKINIILLVDATPGMENFLPAVGEAADQISSSCDCSISAAYYRDAAEGHWLYQTSEMRKQQPGYWLKRLDTQVHFDKDEPEAVYYGLREALRSERLKQGETNILVLVGDAGNHAQEETTQVEASEIVGLLKEKNCHFAAFQTRHPTSDPTFDQFSDQIKNEIMVPVLQKRQLQQKDITVGSTYFSGGTTNFQLLALNRNQTIAPEDLTHEIFSFVAHTIKEVQQRVQSTRNLQEGKQLEITDQNLLSVLETYGVTNQDLQYLKKAYQTNSSEVAKQQ